MTTRSIPGTGCVTEPSHSARASVPIGKGAQTTKRENRPDDKYLPDRQIGANIFYQRIAQRHDHVGRQDQHNAQYLLIRDAVIRGPG